MCEPVTIGALTVTAAEMATAAVVVVSTAATMYGQHQTGKKQADAISKQNALQAEQISQAAGVELGERARAARRERASSRASASESGVNLGSGSFMASLQTSLMNQSNDMGLITRNESGQQASRQAGARSAMSQIELPTAASATFGLTAAAAGSVISSRDASGAGSKRAGAL